MTPDFSCLTGKQRYPDAGAARVALRVLKRDKKLRGHGIDDLEPYRCTGCGGYHLGRRTGGDRRRLRGRRAGDR